MSTLRFAGLVLVLLWALGLPSYAVAPQDVAVVTSDTAHARVAGTNASAPTSRGVIRAGGFDGTNDRDLSVDTSGRLRMLLFDSSSNGISSTGGALNFNLLTSSINLPVSLAAQTLTAIEVSPTNAANTLSNPFFVRLTDGTNGAILADGTATPGSRGVVMVAGNDGSNIRMVSVDASGRLKMLTLDGSGNAITSTSNALDINVKSTTGNIPVSIAAQTLTAVQVSPTNAANTLSNPFFTRQSDADNNGGLVRKNTAPAATQGVFPIGVFDGTNLQFAAGDSSGRVKILTLDGSGNAITSTSNALDTNIKSQTNALKVSKSTSDNAVNNAIFVQQSDGTNSAAGTVGSAVPAGAVMVAGTDGTNARQVAVSSVGHMKTDLSDSSGNGVTSSVSPTGVRALDVAVRTFVAQTPDHIFSNAELTTTATTANQTVLTYTVPTGKEFLLISWGIFNASGTNVDLSPARLRVAGTDISAFASTAAPRMWAVTLGPPGVKIATAGQAITLTVTPGGATNTLWSGFVAGYLRDV